MIKKPLAALALAAGVAIARRREALKIVFTARGCVNCHTQIHGTNNPDSTSTTRAFRR